MKRYNDFRKYMENNWSESTVYKYSNAIHTISNELYNYGLIEYDIYMIENEHIVKNLLEMYLSIPELKAKDIRGNRMYSNAIKRYIEFYNNIYKDITIAEENENYDMQNQDKPQNRPKKVEVVRD